MVLFVRAPVETDGVVAIRTYLVQAVRAALTNEIEISAAEVLLDLMTLVFKGDGVRADADTLWLNLGTYLRLLGWVP